MILTRKRWNHIAIIEHGERLVVLRNTSLGSLLKSALYFPQGRPC